jgi:hypothetical protein
MYEEPHTHPLKPTLRRSEVDQDVLRLAEEIRDVIKNEEMWFILQEWKWRVVDEAIERTRKDAEKDHVEPQFVVRG